jgi:TPP-dependent pyruvate/acetoin dehydrogenase alpha subunit
MHIADPALGVLGANGIVGAGLPLAVGAGLASLRRGTGAVAVAFAGEGAVHGGSFHEALSLAVLWRAPVVFVVEDNRYAEFTESASMWRGAPLVERMPGYGVGFARQVDGNDVRAVRAVAEQAVGHARSGAGPALLHALTYRVHGHYEGDPLLYRDEDDARAWRERDPIALACEILAEEGRAAPAREVLRAAGEEMDGVVELARAAPYPDPGDVLQDVHA